MRDFELAFLNSLPFGNVFFTKALPKEEKISKAVIVHNPSSLRIRHKDDGMSFTSAEHVYSGGRESEDLIVASHNSTDLLRKFIMEAMTTPLGEIVTMKEGADPYRTDKREEIPEDITKMMLNDSSGSIGFKQ